MKKSLNSNNVRNQKGAQIMASYRDLNGLTSADFGRKLGLSRQRAYWWLSGRYSPPTEWLQVAALQEGWPGEMARKLLAQRGLIMAEDAS